ncbi:hypothetical protein RclHR1_16460002 [Rhizophagus clarus]|uniref:HMG box domain-containing protein n=1 Tax=Rhizophagus clarus TaxID=94130 RepID=A0A2Z6RAD5_9GLOM|nr:hypothetical protein RclHR1_16460002 [Rhizophagus clarus]GET02412.1 hypothetical protein GLOIN_2v1590370 [Rhizophagus clarus]
MTDFSYLSQLPTNSSFPFKIPFPPPIEESELKPNMKKGKLPVRATNQFLLYRTAVIKTLRENGVQDINMRIISKMASQLWNLEPAFVQQEYKSLALKAKGLHQKTAKVLTSFNLKETISQRPLAPMPESSENNQNIVDDIGTFTSDTNEVSNFTQNTPPPPISDTYNNIQYISYQEPPVYYDVIPQQEYYIQAGTMDSLPLIYSENLEYHFGYFQ